MNTSSLILLIGTGAIADLIYLPLLTGNPEWKGRVRCIDRNVDLLTITAKRHGVVPSGSDYHPLLRDADVAIVATPPRSHFAIAKDCLAAGVSVIVEKPLTDAHSEAIELVETAKLNNLLLMVNNTRRLFQSYREIHRILVSGELGELISIDYAEGGPFAWPTASGFYFDPKQGGRGVISDRGSHVLDLLCWWAGYPPEFVECRTDVAGGVEGFCDVHLRLKRGKARMRLSWHNKLCNRVVIECSRGRISTGIYDFREITVVRDGQTEQRVMEGGERAYEDYGTTFARKALEAALTGGPPPVIGADVLGSLALIDQCYREATPLSFEWLYKFGNKP